MSDTLRVGIVGCGWFGHFYPDHLRTRNDREVVRHG